VLDRPARQLSKGNRQEIGLILAFMSRPELLVLDEPTSGLDPLMRSEFARLAREVTAEGGTMFWSSHDLDEVQRLADRVAIIKQGRLIATESVEHLRASTPQTVQARFARPVDSALFAGIDGVSVTSCDGGTVQLQVTGAIGPLLRVIADLDRSTSPSGMPTWTSCSWPTTANRSRPVRTDITWLDTANRRRSLIGYCLGMAVYALVVVAMYPAFKTSSSLDKLIASDSTAAAMFGINGPISSTGGWLNGNIYANFFP
jgi:putative AbiEii toxin of type IV toxin-antitoxin system